MSANHIFVAHNSDLQQLRPPSQDATWKKLEGWTVQQLRMWLGMRGVRSSEANKKDLVRIAYFTWKLALPVNQDEVTTQKQAADRLKSILSVDDQTLPDPTTVTNWEPNLKLLPTVTYPNIYNYLIHTPGVTMDELNAYKSLDSFNLAINGWVQELFVHQATEGLVFVKAKVKPSQHSSAPYDAWVMVRRNGTVEAGRCCCTAGLGEVCSHVGALLFKIMGAGLKGLNQPDACTSVACEWNKAFCKQVMPELLDNMNFELPRINKPRQRKRPIRKYSSDSDSSDDEGLWDLLAECSPLAMGLGLLPPPRCSKMFPIIEDVMSEVSVFDSDPIISLPTPVSEIIENSTGSDVFDAVRLSVTAEQSTLVFDSTIGQADKSLWHDVRRHRITASLMGDVYSFMKSKRTTPSVSLMNKIFGTAKCLDGLAAIRWGREHEEEAAYAYSSRLLRGTCWEDMVIEKCGIKIPPGDAHIGASPDGYVTCTCHGERVLEIKAPHTAAMLDLTPLEAAAQGKVDGLHRNGKLKTTHHYYTQVQAQMALLSVTKCDFVVWTPKDFTIETINFDQQYWDLVKASVDSFYKQYVIPRMTTNVNNSDSLADPVPPHASPPKKVQRKQLTKSKR